MALIFKESNAKTFGKKKKKGSSVVPVRLRAFVSAAQVPCARTTSRGLSLQRSACQGAAANPQIEKELKIKPTKLKNLGLAKPWDLGHPIFFSFFFSFFIFLVEIFIRVAYSINTKLQFTVFLHYSHMTSSL